MGEREDGCALGAGNGSREREGEGERMNARLVVREGGRTGRLRECKPGEEGDRMDAGLTESEREWMPDLTESEREWMQGLRWTRTARSSRTSACSAR